MHSFHPPHHTKAPDSKVHGANMGPTLALSGPDGPPVGPMNLAIRAFIVSRCSDVAVKNRHPTGRQGHSQATHDSFNLSHGFLRQDRLYLEIKLLKLIHETIFSYFCRLSCNKNIPTKFAREFNIFTVLIILSGTTSLTWFDLDWDMEK